MLKSPSAIHAFFSLLLLTVVLLLSQAQDQARRRASDTVLHGSEQQRQHSIPAGHHAPGRAGSQRGQQTPNLFLQEIQMFEIVRPNNPNRIFFGDLVAQVVLDVCESWRLW